MATSTDAPTPAEAIPTDIDPPRDGESLSNDDLFHILQNERRRLVLRYLDGREGPIDMRDIAEQVAAWEHDTSVRALTSTQRQRVYIALYQSHLPKLDAHGLITYNQSRGIVERLGAADVASPYLEEVEAEGYGDGVAEEPWPNWYGIATASSALVLGAAWLGLDPVTHVPGLVLATAIAGLYAIITGQYLRVNRKRTATTTTA